MGNRDEGYNISENKDFRIFNMKEGYYLQGLLDFNEYVGKPNRDFVTDRYIGLKCSQTGKKIYEGDGCMIDKVNFIVGINDNNEIVKIINKDGVEVDDEYFEDENTPLYDKRVFDFVVLTEEEKDKILLVGDIKLLGVIGMMSRLDELFSQP